VLGRGVEEGEFKSDIHVRIHPICADDCVMIRSRFLSQFSGKSWTRFSGAKSATAHVDATANNAERATNIPNYSAVAPVPDFPGALGRVKGPLRRCAPLTRPARSRLVCNYRSDGRIGEFKFASRVLSSPSTNQLTACAWNAAPNFSSRRWSFVSI
jgi:hypothetical protein